MHPNDSIYTSWNFYLLTIYIKRFADQDGISIPIMTILKLKSRRITDFQDPFFTFRNS